MTNQILLALLLAAGLVGLLIVLSDQFKLFRSAKQEVDSYVNTSPPPKLNADMSAEALFKLGKTLIGTMSKEDRTREAIRSYALAIEALNAVKRQRASEQDLAVIYQLLLEMRRQRNEQMHLPNWSKNYSSEPDFVMGSYVGQVSVFVRPEDQPEAESIPINDNTIAQVEAFLKKQQEQSGIRT